MNQRLFRLLLPAWGILSLAFAGHVLHGLRTESKGLRTASRSVLTKAAYEGEDASAAVQNVVERALAFKAMLTPEQQQVLEQPYTQALARRWSNLPCANTCRNGIGLGTLTTEQLAAALEVIRAAEGTVANEGSEEFNQIRMADGILAGSSSSGAPGGGGPGGGPGGLSYGSGNYYLAFLNTPSTTGAWMMQFGGHHYGANIAFNQGHYVATTPLFEALEPTSFTVDDVTYSPLTQERDALSAMLAALTPDQLANAKLSQTFSDVTMSPGETNGGNGVFPTVKAGLPVSALDDNQKLLVLEAMKPWVTDMEDTVAANLLAIYGKELNDTYIAFTGNGTAGDPSTFLVSNTNYARIDGPSVWIEFACQSGVVYRNQIHYHTVWRDHLRDYGLDLSLTEPLDKTEDPAASTLRASAPRAFRFRRGGNGPAMNR